MKTRLYLAAVAAALLLIPARAEDCAKPVVYATIPLMQIEGDNREFVPVAIAGVPKLMLLDTGAFFTTISPEAADELHLESVPAAFRLYNIRGAKTERFVSTSFQIGGMRGDGIQFMVDAASASRFGDPRVAGLLGASILTNYDLSIDFGTHTLDLVSPNRCGDQSVYWPERPIVKVPFKLQQRSQIIVSVMLDGEEFKAQLDTGAGISTLEKGKAERSYNLVLGSDDTPVATTPDSAWGMTTWDHRFKSLSLAGIEVKNPRIRIIPDKISEQINTWSTGSLLDKRHNSTEMPPMWLGLDVLKDTHIYISYRDKMIYITPSRKPAAAAPAK